MVQQYILLNLSQVIKQWFFIRSDYNKKTILIIITVLLFTGCTFLQSQRNIHYTFGVIETSSARKYTVIKYYNDDGKKVASTKLDEAEVGVSFNTISYHNGYAYINNIGLQGHKNPQNVIQIKGNSNEVKKLHLPRTTIDAVCADDHYYKVKIYLEETKW